MMQQVKPLTPAKILGKKSSLPNGIVESINYFLTIRYNGEEVKITNKELLERFLRKNPGVQKNELTREDCINVENLFNAFGWEVRVHIPYVHEAWESHFIFFMR
jgi:hypothetical protein